MAMQYRTRGFVFKKKNLGESDRVFSVFTEDYGRLELFAKAVRKIDAKLRGGIDNFFWSEVEFVQGKNRKTLTDAQVVKKASSEVYTFAAKVSSALDGALQGSEKDQPAFYLLEEVFSYIEKEPLTKEKQSLLYAYFVWNLSASQGKHPELYQCAICKGKLSSAQLLFSFKEGGLLCMSCQKNDRYAMPVSEDMIKVLRVILKKEWGTLSRLSMQKSSYISLYEFSNRALELLHS